MRAPKHACANHERMMGNDTVAEMAEVMVGSVSAYASDWHDQGAVQKGNHCQEYD